MSANLIVLGLTGAGAVMTLFGVLAALRSPARRLERVPWIVCGLALCAFAMFVLGGRVRRDTRATTQAFKSATAQLRRTEVSYRKRTGRWQTDVDALSLQIGCYGVAVEWVGPAGGYFRGFSSNQEVAILHAAGRYEVVAVDEYPGGTKALELDAKRGGSVTFAAHRPARSDRALCRA